MIPSQSTNYLAVLFFRLMSYPKKSFAVITISLITLATVTPLKAATQSPGDINVLSSIKPIQLISTAIIGDLGQSNLLLPPSANPHHYQLRPSQRSLLNNADLFIWVGPELELFLVKVLKVSSIKQLSLIQTLDLQPKSSHQHSTDHHSDHEDHSDHSAHHHDAPDGFDPHIWLDPAFTQQIAEATYHQLASLYPSLEPQLKHNLEQFLIGLKETEQQIKQQLDPAKQLTIYTFHQAFTHFAEHYGLKISGIITPTPEARPGARHLTQLANEIGQHKQICLVKEPNFKAPYIDSITKGSDVITTIADPLATNIDNSANSYFEFISSIANSFSACISNASK